MGSIVNIAVNIITIAVMFIITKLLITVKIDINTYVRLEIYKNDEKVKD